MSSTPPIKIVSTAHSSITPDEPPERAAIGGEIEIEIGARHAMAMEAVDGRDSRYTPVGTPADYTQDVGTEEDPAVTEIEVEIETSAHRV